MAARATRSASGAASSSDDASRCLLLALSHDELGVIVDGLADPLQPVVAVALSSTCLGLRTPLRPALEVLKERHEKAKALCDKLNSRRYIGMSEVILAELPRATVLNWVSRHLTADDMATLGMITSGMPMLRELLLIDNGFGDPGTTAMCQGLPSLKSLDLGCNKLGPVGAEALAAALHRGALLNLEKLALYGNPIGSEGVAALAKVLRRAPALLSLKLSICKLGDDGVAMLLKDLSKDDFKTLQVLDLENNDVTIASATLIASAIERGMLPDLAQVRVRHGKLDGIVYAALDRRGARKLLE